MIEEHTSTDITARCNDKDRPSALAIKIFGDRGFHFHSYLNLSVCFFTAFFLLVSSKLFYKILNCSENKLLKKLHKLFVHNDYVVSHGEKKFTAMLSVKSKVGTHLTRTFSVNPFHPEDFSK